MVFQHFSLFETLTVVREHLADRAGNEARTRATHSGDRARISGSKSIRRPMSIPCLSAKGSGSRSSLPDDEPKLLILDEPTSVLPPQSVGLLFDTLRRLRDTGVSILFISHKLDEIQSICDRATCCGLVR